MCNNDLQHHGILGQKWGVRRYQNSDGTLTDAGKKHYALKGYKEDMVNSYKTKFGKGIDKITRGSTDSAKILYNISTKSENTKRANKYLKEHGSETKKGLSDNQKKAIKVGAAAVGTALAAYGAYKLSKNPSVKSAVAQGKTKVQELLSKNGKSKITPHQDFLNARTKKSVAEMSSAELSDKIKRLNLEKQYSMLNSQMNPNARKEAISKVTKSLGTIAATTGTALTLYSNIDRISKIVESKSKQSKKKQ